MENKLRSGESTAPMTVCQLYESFSATYYWTGDEDYRRMKLTDDSLEPYKLIGRVIETSTESLGGEDTVQMLNMFIELDQSYDGFYDCRAALEREIRKRDTNSILRIALNQSMKVQ